MRHLRPLRRAAGILLLASTLALSLHAQDVSVSDPTWLKPSRPNGDTPPRYLKRLAPRYPAELAKNNLHGYALAIIYVHADGDNLGPILCSHPLIEVALEQARAHDSFKPATKDGLPIGTWIISTILFNPSTAKPDLADRTARLLTVEPIEVPARHIPKKRSSLTIPSTIHLDHDGKITRIDLPAELAPEIKTSIDASLARWSFSPAHKAGQPVATQLALPLVIHRPLEGDNYNLKVPVKPITRVQPKYPYAMRYYELGGEVLCSFIVDKKGNVKNAYAMTSSHPLFTEAALNAVREWKFQPATINGKPVAARSELPITFNYPGGDQVSGKLKGGAKDATKLPEGFCYDKAPQPRTQTSPVYPYELLAKKISGSAKIVFAVDPEGEVKHVKIVEASHPEFGQALAAAASTYRFKPATLRGQPAVAAITFQHDFEPESDASDEDLRLLKYELKQPEKILKASQLDTPLKPIARKPPKPPIVVNESGATGPGEAVLHFLIDEQGVVRLPRVISATTPAHGHAAIQAITEWEFSPPLSGGKPVIVQAKVPFSFIAQPPEENTDDRSSDATK